MLSQVDSVDAVGGLLQPVLLRAGGEEIARFTDDIAVGDVHDDVMLGDSHDVLRSVLRVHHERQSTRTAGPLVLSASAKGPNRVACRPQGANGGPVGTNGPTCTSSGGARWVRSHGRGSAGKRPQASKEGDRCECSTPRAGWRSSLAKRAWPYCVLR